MASLYFLGKYKDLIKTIQTKSTQTKSSQIVSAIHSLIYNLFLAQTLQPLTGKSESHIFNGLHRKDPKNPTMFHRPVYKFRRRILFHTSLNKKHIKHNKDFT